MSDDSDSPVYSDLHDYLPPALYAQLLREGTLPASVLRAEYERLRIELRAMTGYIPAMLVREHMASPKPGQVHGAFWDGTILFADLSGFTALSERLSTLGKQGAEEISAIISTMFSSLVAVVYQWGGELLKFGGDALTAFFDERSLGSGHATLACCAALEMQEQMREFAALQTRAGVFRLRLRIGVHSGHVFAAQVGDRSHIELIVTGPNVNRVASAQEIAEPGDVVISAETLGFIDRANASEREHGFHLLHDLERITPLPHQAVADEGDTDIAGLARMARQIDALRPFLPAGLPQRFLGWGAGVGEIGEFRPVTIVFANMYPFNDVLGLLGDDADTAAQAYNAYYLRAQSIIHRYGGMVNKVDMYTHGDKLMALFGAPVVHEDDPARAVRAACELNQILVDANREIGMLLNDRPFAGLSQRIGINTGVVFAGNVGSIRRHEYTVMGQPVNLAARIMSVAQPDAIILSPTTYAATRPIVDVRQLAPVALKGVEHPLPLAEVSGLLDDVRGKQRLPSASLVGREQELAVMIECGRLALAGSGQVLALVGEAGTGKTRLIDEFIERLTSIVGDSADPSFLFARVECLSYEQTTPYTAIRHLLRQVLALTASQSAQALLQRIDDLAPDLARFAPVLGSILGIAIDETPLTLGLTPEQRHDRAEELMTRLMLNESRAQSLLLIVDDMHWVDASSLELLERLSHAGSHAAILLVFGYRPDPAFPEPWEAFDHCRRLSLGELDDEQRVHFLRTILDSAPPPELTQLIAPAQGNPFFIEEVIRSLVETGVLRRDADGWTLASAPESVVIPNSIEGVITARLDRLEERSREILQTAAVIGSRFDYPTLAALLTNSSDILPRLTRLAQAMLIIPEDLERELAYLFKHVLTRDVAYESILFARRRQLHLRVARQIESRSGIEPDEQLALIARHYLLAEEWAPAFEYHLHAGRVTQRRYAHREAITLLSRALEIAPRISVDALEAKQLDEVRERLGFGHTILGEYGLALEYFESALSRLQGRADVSIEALLRLHHHIARVFEKRAEFETAFNWVERALLLDGASTSPASARCLLLGAGLHQRQGRYQQALEWAERALYVSRQNSNLIDEAEALKLQGNTAGRMGDHQQARDLLARAIDLYQTANDLNGLSYAHNDLAVAYYELGQLADAGRHYEEGAAIKQAIGDIYGEAMIANNLGELRRLLGDFDGAIEQYLRSLAIFERLGSIYGAGLLQMNLGATFLALVDLDNAEERLARAGELFGRAGSEDFLPELERYRAELALARGDLPAAMQRIEEALATAVRLEARVEEGMTRRVRARILAAVGDVEAGWLEIEHSIGLLREAESRYEIARALFAQAELAPLMQRIAQGQTALNEAIRILREIGARYDLTMAQTAATRYGYMVE